MAFFLNPRNVLILSFTMIFIIISSNVVSCSNYFEDFEIKWGEGRGEIINNGEFLTLSLDNHSGSGFESKNEYMFGQIDMQLKLVPGNSAGTVIVYYLSSQGLNHDEIDFEFLGNLSREPYTIHTNVYTQGKGEREQQFHLWFDPTLDFLTYSVLWNPQTILFSVNNTPLKEFKNLETVGVPFPRSQPMKLYSSIWNADQWATRGGLIKTYWTQAPFTASYRNYSCKCMCHTNGGPVSCTSGQPNNYPWLPQRLDNIGVEKLKWVQHNYMIYNYCTDTKRFPPECNA